MNLELNITLQCNQACPNCNRMCDIYRDRTEHMSVEQIEKFVEQAKQHGNIGLVKVAGGEPLLNPHFVEIYDVLVKAAQDKIIGYIKIETNKILPKPKVTESQLVKWQGRVLKKKKHQPVLWSPSDLGVKTNCGCQMLRRCGFSLDKYGYLPCSASIMIVRLFGLTHLYKHDLPKEAWGLEELCHHCVFSMSADWRAQYSSKSPTQHTKEERTPTKSYKEKMDQFNVEEFYKTQKEF